jgi:hypothetical protein
MFWYYYKKKDKNIKLYSQNKGDRSMLDLGIKDMEEITFSDEDLLYVWENNITKFTYFFDYGNNVLTIIGINSVTLPFGEDYSFVIILR